MRKHIGLLVLITVWAQGAAPSKLEKINWGVSERQGKRPEMEDAYAAVLDFKDNPEEAFFGIYDGHGGILAALITAEGKFGVSPLHEMIAKSSLSGECLYKRNYLKMDTILRKDFSTGGGTTAITAHIIPGRDNPEVYLAWVGDARAVLVRQNGTVSDSGTSVDHKPNDPKEKKRIIDAGGYINNEGYVGGLLAIPRSLGDGDVKNQTKGIIADPDVKGFNLLPHHKALILACDGVWDVLSNEKAAIIVSGALQHTGPLSADEIAKIREQTHESGNNDRAIMAARALRDAAYNAGSTDNISVLVIEFDWGEPKTTFGQVPPAKREPKTTFGSAPSSLHK